MRARGRSTARCSYFAATSCCLLPWPSPKSKLIARARPGECGADVPFRGRTGNGRPARTAARTPAEQGALTLDLNPEALTSSVLNQYLTVKERARV